MDWIDSKTIRFGETDFEIIDNLVDMLNVESTGRRFLLGKTRSMIETYIQALADMHRPNIFELGVFKGGSSAFLHALCQPRKLVAIEFEKQRVAALDQFIREKDCTETLIPYYGVNQADSAALNEIIEHEFKGEELDLVVDDASHFLKETRASFNVLFPRLRRGGIYIIEDWGWAHVPNESLQKRRGVWSNQPAMSTLLFEIIMATVTQEGMIESININAQMAVIVRGNHPVAMPFDISNSYLTRGRSFKPRI